MNSEFMRKYIDIVNEENMMNESASYGIDDAAFRKALSSIGLKATVTGGLHMTAKLFRGNVHVASISEKGQLSMKSEDNDLKAKLKEIAANVKAA